MFPMEFSRLRLSTLKLLSLLGRNSVMRNGFSRNLKSSRQEARTNSKIMLHRNHTQSDPFIGIRPLGAILAWRRDPMYTNAATYTFLNAALEQPVVLWLNGANLAGRGVLPGRQ